MAKSNNGRFTKDSAARLGAIGGKRRARALTKAERSRIARIAGLARHGLTASGRKRPRRRRRAAA